MKVSSNIEDYVKSIYTYTEWQSDPITSSRLATHLGVANSSVSEMVRKLHDMGLVQHHPYSHLTLTPSGRALALKVIRKHRLVETFLAHKLHYAWDQIHDEAERLEHVVSELFIERISAQLGHPQRNPYGDPIPDAQGVIHIPQAEKLLTFPPETEGVLVRISDANPDLLRYLAQENIALDIRLQVLGRKPFGGSITVTFDTPHHKKVLDVGDEIAEALWIAPKQQSVDQ